MRLKMVFQLAKPELDIEYRRTFLSLLKKCFQQASPEVFKYFYETGTTMKPFTFGVYLPQPRFEKDVVRLQANEITLNFSTFAADLGIYFYNSIIKNRFTPYPLPRGNKLTLKRVALQKERRIDSTEMLFKTLSPILVRRHGKETNDDSYLTKNDDLFIPQMEENIRVMLEQLYGKAEQVEFLPVKLKDSFPIKHFGQYMDGHTGLFKLTGAMKALDFIYKCGIGSRRSEGFGCIEVAG